METHAQLPRFFYHPVELPLLFHWLDSFAHTWLAEVGIATPDAFNKWAIIHSIAICSIYPNSIIMLDNPVVNCRTNIHILAEDKTFFTQHQLHRQFLRVLHDVFKFHRVEVWVSPTAGHTIRKLLRDLDFQRDVVLKSAWLNQAFSPPLLQDMEIWSNID